jgi:hypothetical protein
MERGRCVRLTNLPQLTVSRLSRQCLIFNILQPYRPPRPVTGIALIYIYIYIYTNTQKSGPKVSNLISKMHLKIGLKLFYSTFYKIENKTHISGRCQPFLQIG